MRAGLSAIMLSVVQPVAIFVGLPLWLIFRYKLKTMLDYEEPLEISTNGWPSSPEHDPRVFYPQKKR